MDKFGAERFINQANRYLPKMGFERIDKDDVCGPYENGKMGNINCYANVYWKDAEHPSSWEDPIPFMYLEKFKEESGEVGWKIQMGYEVNPRYPGDLFVSVEAPNLKSAALRFLDGAASEHQDAIDESKRWRDSFVESFHEIYGEDDG